MRSSNSGFNAVPAYTSIEYNTILGAVRTKGSAKTVAHALSKAVSELTGSLYRGTMQSLQVNAPEVLGAISEYALQWLIYEDMIPYGYGLMSDSLKVGIWTGSFLQSLEIKDTHIGRGNVSKVYYSNQGSYITASIGIIYNPLEPRYERSDNPSIDGTTYKDKVGDYGEWLMSKFARFANGSAGLKKNVEPLFRSTVEDLLAQFRKDYKVSRWGTSGALSSLYRRIDWLTEANMDKIRQAARIRIAEQQRTNERRRAERAERRTQGGGS